jgi:hypothetical protein
MMRLVKCCFAIDLSRYSCGFGALIIQFEFDLVTTYRSPATAFHVPSLVYEPS